MSDQIAGRADALAQVLARTITTELPEPESEADVAAAFIALGCVVGSLLAALPPTYREVHLLGFIEAGCAAYRDGCAAAEEDGHGG